MGVTVMKRFGVAIVAGLCVLGLTVPKAQAQNPWFQVRPGLTLQQAAFNVAVMGQALQNVPTWAFGSNAGFISPGLAARLTSTASPYVNPYASMYANPYLASQYSSLYGGGYPYYQDPNGAALYGSSQVIKSQGQFMVDQQQAYLMREQVRQSRMDTRLKMLDEYLYERERTP